jgi:hypothetical protein
MAVVQKRAVVSAGESLRGLQKCVRLTATFFKRVGVVDDPLVGRYDG